MPLIDAIRSIVPGNGSEAASYRCAECGTSFQSLEDEDSYWLRCPDCDAEDVELAEAG